MQGFINGLKKIKTAVTKKIKLLQRSNEKTKRKWVIGGSVLMMIVVIFLWVAYLNTSLPDLTLAPEETEQIEPVEKESIIKIVSRGANVLYTNIEESFSSSFKKVKTYFEKEREFEFSN